MKVRVYARISVVNMGCGDSTDARVFEYKGAKFDVFNDILTVFRLCNGCDDILAAFREWIAVEYVEDEG